MQHRMARASANAALPPSWTGNSTEPLAIDDNADTPTQQVPPFTPHHMLHSSSTAGG